MLTFNEMVTVIALLLGPLAAVALTLVNEHYRRIRDRRLQIMRMLLATRHLPADPQYNNAINLIPVEFNDQPGVVAAWQQYHAVLRENPGAGQRQQDDHLRRLNFAQSKLISEVLRSVGLELSEADIQTQIYVSHGFVERDNIWLASLRATPEIAAALKQQVELTQRMIEAAQRKPASPSAGERMT